MDIRKAAAKLSHIGWSFVDQGVVSGGNFLLNMFLARALPPQAYGTFAVFYLATVGANTCHSSVVTYWLNVTGANADRPALKKLTAGALGITTVWGVPYSLIILIASIVVRDLSLWIPATIAMLAWQWQESARRGLLCQARYRSAVLPDALSYLGQAALVALLRPTSLLLVFWIMAVTSILGLLWQTALVGISRISAAEFKNDLVESLRLGRFVAVANGVNMIALQIPTWALLASSGKGSVATFQTLMNVVGAANPLLLGIGNHLVPAVARAAATRGTEAARRVVLTDGAAAGAILLVYMIAVLLFPAQIMTVIYGRHSLYLSSAPLLQWFVLVYIFQFGASLVGAYEAGLGRTATYMNAQFASLAGLCVAGVPLIYRYGVAGAVASTVIVHLLRMSVISLLSYRHNRGGRNSRRESGVDADSAMQSMYPEA